MFNLSLVANVRKPMVHWCRDMYSLMVSWGNTQCVCVCVHARVLLHTDNMKQLPQVCFEEWPKKGNKITKVWT